MAGTATPRLPTRGRAPLDLSRLLLGLVVLALGVLFLLDAAGELDAGAVIGDWWPVWIVLMGTFQLIEQPARPVGPLVVAGIGVALLLVTADAISWDYFWPIALMLGGLAIIARTHARPLRSPATDTDLLRLSGIFGGPEVASNSTSFRGAALTAVFGGVMLDLRGATPAPEGARVNATAAFGGIDILVPRGWNVAITGTPLFGGIEDKTDHDQPLAPDAPKLSVDALAVFGGVSVKHEK